MSNSKTVIERVLRDYECVVCGSREYDVQEVTEVGESQDTETIGHQYDKCRKCGEMYPTNPNHRTTENGFESDGGSR